MENPVVCKMCKYVTREDTLGDVCPACGLPRKNFEPYKDNRSAKRRFIMGLNLHPIAVHFPQAYAVISLPLIPAGVYLNLPFSGDLLSAAKVLGMVLPFTVIAAIMAGLIDGKARFRRLTPPLLIIKMMAGSFLLIFSILMAFIIYAYGFAPPGFYYIILLNLGCIACQVVLGEVGKTLMSAHLPG